MANDVRVTNWPDGGSHEEVAFKLWSALRNYDADAETQLQFYAKCRRAAYGSYEFRPKD